MRLKCVCGAFASTMDANSVRLDSVRTRKKARANWNCEGERVLDCMIIINMCLCLYGCVAMPSMSSLVRLCLLAPSDVCIMGNFQLCYTCLSSLNTQYTHTRSLYLHKYNIHACLHSLLSARQSYTVHPTDRHAEWQRQSVMMWRVYFVRRSMPHWIDRACAIRKCFELWPCQAVIIERKV